MSRSSGKYAAGLLVFTLPCSAFALTDDRIAVEVLKGESPRDATLAFEEACYRLGLPKVDADPVQPFTHGGHSFVRLAVDGPPAISRCVSRLDPGRAGVSGAVHWMDGFAGGLVVNRPGAEDRVPDSEWFNPATPKIVQPPVDTALIEHPLAEKFLQLNLDAALTQVRALAARGGAAPLAVLEEVARRHAQWRVRRAAVESLNPVVSLRVLMEVLRSDPDWEVRDAAVILLQPMANAAILAATPESPEAGDVLLERLQHDPSWEVRRRIIWSLSTELVQRAKETLRSLAAKDPSSPVRAAALEALAGAHFLSHRELRDSLHDAAPEIRATAAGALAADMEESDAPVLWQALNDPDRSVRLTVVGFVTRLTDPSIGPRLWELFVQETRELDADPAFERAVLDELSRAPFPGLSQRIQELLSVNALSPDERRLLVRLLARIDAQRATALMVPWLSGADAFLRSLAADAIPVTPATKQRRLELLNDPDVDVRASAILGLCRVAGNDQAVAIAVHQTQLGTTPLSQEATLAVPHCGRPELPMPTFHTALAMTSEAPATGNDGATAPALAAIVLMLLSVVVIKLASAPDRQASPKVESHD